MRHVALLPSFQRAFKKLDPASRQKVVESLQQFNEFLVSGQISGGLGLKKINHDKYEFRVDIRLRIVMKLEKDTFYLVLVGNHDEIRKYLRDFR